MFGTQTAGHRGAGRLRSRARLFVRAAASPPGTVGAVAVVSYATRAGEPRSSGVVYTTVGQRLYVATAPESWKARHIAATGHVALTVPLRRGGILSLVVPQEAGLVPASREAQGKMPDRDHPRG